MNYVYVSALDTKVTALDESDLTQSVPEKKKKFEVNQKKNSSTCNLSQNLQ